MYVLPPLLVYISEVPENWNGTNKGNSLFTKMLHNNQIETLQLTKLIDSNVSSYLLSLLIIKKSTVQRLNRIGWGISKVFQQTTKTGSWLAESQLNHINTSLFMARTTKSKGYRLKWEILQLVHVREDELIDALLLFIPRSVEHSLTSLEPLNALFAQLRFRDSCIQHRTAIQPPITLEIP